MADSSRVRICVVTAAYPSPEEPTRARFLENYLLALREQGFDLAVVTPRVHAGDPLEELRRGIEVARFRYPTSGRRLKELDRPSTVALGLYVASGVSRALATIVHQESDLVYAHWVLPAGVIGTVAAAVAGLPMVVHAHGSDIHRYAGQSSFSRQACQTVLRAASRVVAVSRDLVETMVVRFGLEPDTAQVVPMGVDEDVFPADATERPENDRLRLLYVGDLDEHKGIVDLARRLTSDVGLRDVVRLDLVGDGIESNALQGLARHHSETLKLHGRLEPDDVARRCQLVDALVLPSRGEGAPLVVMEAVVSGLPVLATPVGGIPELVEHGKNGWIERVEDFLPRIRYLRDRREDLEALRSSLPGEISGGLGARHRACQAAPILKELVARPNLLEKRQLVTAKP